MKKGALFTAIAYASVYLHFPDELIMNYWPDKFFDYLGINR